MSNQSKKVRRADVAACMSCKLCKKLLVEATTISLCLHTFCRKCIYEKLSDDECDTCPVCDISLGCNPVDKLRPDHNLQDIRSKIFPIKRRMVEAPEAVPSVSPPAKRKERSLSSLVVSTPRVPMHASVTGRRTRAGLRKSSAPRRSSPTEEPPKEEQDSIEDHMEGPSSPETLNKIIKNKKLVSSSAKSSSDQIPKEDEGNRSVEGKIDLWKPLNCLVEAANRTKFSKSNLLGSSYVKVEPSSVQDNDNFAARPDVKENGHTAEAKDDKSIVPSAPGPVKRKRRASNRSIADTPGNLSNSSQLVVDVMRHHRQNVPIWFSLVASEDQNREGAAPLPQISAGFLRVKNGNMPVSYIQKYIAKKLELASEDEVQLMCQGQAVTPSLQLRNLLDMWLRASPTPSRIKTNVGNSGKEFVMVLNYSRKVQVKVHQAQAQVQVQLQAENNSS